MRTARAVSPSGKASGKVSSRALFPSRSPRRFEFHEWQLSPHAREPEPQFPADTMPNLVVAAGTLELHVEGDRTLLSSGDAAQFNADMHQVYRNPGGEALQVYVAIVFSEPVP